MKNKICIILIFLTVLTCLTVNDLKAQTILSPGDIQILKIGEGEVAPWTKCVLINPAIAPFYFKNKVPLAPGTQIYFTDCGVRSDGTFLPSSVVPGNEEGHILYTVPTIIYEGYIPFLIYRADTDSSWATLSGKFWPRTTFPGGDQIICYQMVAGNPVFITALNYFGTGWQAEANTLNESTLPPGLIDGVNAFALNRLVFTGHIAYFDDPETPAPITPFNLMCKKTIHRGVWPPSIPHTGGGGSWTWNDISSWWLNEWNNVYNASKWKDITDSNIYDIALLPVNVPPVVEYPWTTEPIELRLVSYSDGVIIDLMHTSGTCPVELSSFTAVSSLGNSINLQWVTQTETELSGYYLLRSQAPVLNNAVLISNLISATNTSQEVSYSFTDEEVVAGIWYYWLENLNLDGSMEYHGPISVTLSAGDNPNAPITEVFPKLSNIYPNPFRQKSTISYELGKSEDVYIEIYNLKGEKIRTLISGFKVTGLYNLVWDGKDDKNKVCTAGVYFIKLSTLDYSAIRKIVLIK